MRTYETLDEVLPNVVYRRPDGRGAALSSSAVVGRIAGVDRGRAFVNGSPESAEVPFDDPDADWRTMHLRVDVERTERLMGDIPAGVAVVSESGIARAEQLNRLEQAGVAAVLVGETLMRSTDPEAALRTLLGDRAERAPGRSERPADQAERRAERRFE